MIARHTVPKPPLCAAALLLVAVSLAIFSIPARGAEDAPTGIKGIGPTAAPVEIEGTFRFTEGPAADAKGVVYFTDVPASAVYRVDAPRGSTLVRDETNRTNGQMFNAAGEMVGCQRGGIEAVSPDGGKRRMLVETYNGKPFNGPNDLVIDRTGGVYFSDPSFNVGREANQDVAAVYYVTPDGIATRVVTDVLAPNGVILAPDEKTLYVVSTVRGDVMAYPIESHGRVGAGRVFCTLRPKEGSRGAGGDGCAVDVQGNLYIATGAGLQVFDAKGQPLGVIELPKPPSNCTFGGPDMKTLYVTARTSVYALPMEIAGHRFPAGEAGAR